MSRSPTSGRPSGTRLASTSISPVGRFIQRGWIEEAWPHGFVYIKLLGDLPAGAGALREARAAARYLAKYIGKDLAEQPDGLHRYEVAQGFQPRRVEYRGASAWAALAEASKAMGGRPSHVWHSSEVEDWGRPPALWAQWNG